MAIEYSLNFTSIPEVCYCSLWELGWKYRCVLHITLRKENGNAADNMLFTRYEKANGRKICNSRAERRIEERNGRCPCGPVYSSDVAWVGILRLGCNFVCWFGDKIDIVVRELASLCVGMAMIRETQRLWMQGIWSPRGKLQFSRDYSDQHLLPRCCRERWYMCACLWKRGRVRVGWEKPNLEL